MSQATEHVAGQGTNQNNTLDAMSSTQASLEKLQTAFSAKIQEEMELFSQEAQSRRQCAMTANYVIGTEQEKKQLQGSINKLAEFRQESVKVTKSINEDIHHLKSDTLNGFSLIEEAKLQEQRNNDPRYVDFMKARPLDPANLKKLQEIRSKHHNLEVALKDVNACLDSAWDEQQFAKGQSKRVMDFIYQTLSNHHNIITNLQEQLKVVKQRLHEVQSYDISAWPIPRTPVATGPQDVEISSIRKSLKKWKIDDVVTHMPISAKKKSQLKDLLSQRSSTPIRSAKKTIGAAAVSRLNNQQLAEAVKISQTTPAQKDLPLVVNIGKLESMKESMPPPVTFAPVGSSVKPDTAKVLNDVIAEMAMASRKTSQQFTCGPKNPAAQLSPTVLPKSPENLTKPQVKTSVASVGLHPNISADSMPTPVAFTPVESQAAEPSQIVLHKSLEMAKPEPTPSVSPDPNIPAPVPSTELTLQPDASAPPRVDKKYINSVHTRSLEKFFNSIRKSEQDLHVRGDTGLRLSSEETNKAASSENEAEPALVPSTGKTVPAVGSFDISAIMPQNQGKFANRETSPTYGPGHLLNSTVENMIHHDPMDDDLDKQIGQDKTSELEAPNNTSLKQKIVKFSHPIDFSIHTSSIAMLDGVYAKNRVCGKERKTPLCQSQRKKKTRSEPARKKFSTLGQAKTTKIETEIAVKKTTSVFDIVKQVSTECNRLLMKTIFTIGPIKVSVMSFWSLIPPSALTGEEVRNVRDAFPKYNPGWLSSTVIDSYLWGLQQGNEKFFAADTTILQLVTMRAKFQNLWRDVNFEPVQVFIIPLNITGHRWTLFVVDRRNEQRYYLDPLLYSQERVFGNDGTDELTRLKVELSELVDLKTGWGCSGWPFLVRKSYGWGLQHEKVFAADTTVFKLVTMRAKFQNLWRDANFEPVQVFVIPLNITGGHWTLFVVDTRNEQRYYLDPLSSQERVFSNDGTDQLSCLIMELSKLIDLKTGWNCKDWPCTEPLHCYQQDDYNCGVYICLFARCFAENHDLPKECLIDVEREEIAWFFLRWHNVQYLLLNERYKNIYGKPPGIQNYRPWPSCSGG